MKRKIICIDFDGVVHGYQSGWQGITSIPDSPVPGAIEWLRSLIADPHLEPGIYSSRSAETRGIHAMQAWCIQHGLTPDEVAQLRFWDRKPPAFITIDDRAICFVGEFPSAESIHAFRTWQQ